jgi:hypothetical protein
MDQGQHQITWLRFATFHSCFYSAKYCGVEEAVDVFVSVCWLAPGLSRDYEHYDNIVDSLPVVHAVLFDLDDYKVAAAHFRDMVSSCKRERTRHGVFSSFQLLWTESVISSFFELTRSTFGKLFLSIGVNLAKLSSDQVVNVVRCLHSWCVLLTSDRFRVGHK